MRVRWLGHFRGPGVGSTPHEMEQVTNNKKQAVTMETIESAIISHRSLVSSWLERAAKCTSNAKSGGSDQTRSNGITERNKDARQEHQGTYSRLGIGAKHAAPSGTSDSLQMQRMRERVMRQNGTSYHALHKRNDLATDRMDEMESRDRIVGQAKKRRF
jgi:hypothetical protein